ncbi:Periplasmic binding protein [Candidatus Methanoperedenaceae archaeon GB50]|nr:Periplasmic binding protein [Candidatus Methanoperedenaceae archaeon GB50]CAD7773833.1 MAG: Periplasmic binding protein [Candidatus Methanoperedenaceae archaeon GB50]
MRSRSFILAALMVVLTALSGCVEDKTPIEEASTEEIPVGILVDLSGPLTTYGEDIKNTVTIASEEINNYFKANGKPYRVKLYIEDTRVDPKIALDKVMALHGKGVKLIVGPMGSGEVKQVAGYANANGIILISPSSTAAVEDLGITTPEEKKYIYRFVALDTFQTRAIARELDELGIKAVCIVYIGNAWGKGLNDHILPELERYGIKVEKSIDYPDPPPADFTPYIATLEGAVDGLSRTYAMDEIAVVAFSYEEVFTMLSQAGRDSILFNVTWVGCDGTAKSEKIREVCDKVNAVGFYSTLFESRGEAFDNLNATYYKRFNRSAYQYGLNSYDALWVLALAYEELREKGEEYSADAMRALIPGVTERFSRGEYDQKTVSGYIMLDEYNDRASGDYAIYRVSNCSWTKAGLWRYETNEIRWN